MQETSWNSNNTFSNKIRICVLTAHFIYLRLRFLATTLGLEEISIFLAKLGQWIQKISQTHWLEFQLKNIFFDLLKKKKNFYQTRSSTACNRIFFPRETCKNIIEKYVHKSCFTAKFKTRPPFRKYFSR